MTKRLDKKYWKKGYKKCNNCVIEEEHKIRMKGKDAWKKYENKKKKANAISWLKDQEQGFNEWKEMTLKPKTEIVNEDGSLEKCESSQTANKKFVENMQKEFNNMKKEVLSKFE